MRRANKELFKPRSNTGHLGISETVYWSKSRRYDVFDATCWRGGKRKHKRFFFHDTPTKKRALAQALDWRKKQVEQERTERTEKA